MQRQKTGNRRIIIKFLSVTQFLVAFVCAFFDFTHAAIGRDLVLTPKQGLQLHGKSIFYEDKGKEYLRNESIRPWERTLKHVTFVTLFTDGTSTVVDTNNSKWQQYSNFLQSPYITQQTENNGRFGDIVTLASGWLERYNQNDSVKYRFVEGRCEAVCLNQLDNMVTLWLVQKIRHRDGSNHRFRYEIKFSISPLRPHNGETLNNAGESTLVKREQSVNNLQRSFIQREDDYPQSFGRIIYPDEEIFADRQPEASTLDLQYMRNKPLRPEATFLNNLLLPPPLPPARTDRLNIGEYIRDSGDGGFSKIELYPNVYGMLQPRPHATTYQPHYQPQQTKPEVLTFNTHSAQPILLDSKQPLIAHHYHHHYYMPNGGSLENELSSAEHLSLSETESDSNYLNNQRFDTRPSQLPLPPAPQKHATVSTPYGLYAADIEQQRVVHVTPMTQLRAPNYQAYPLNYHNKDNFLFYPTHVENVQTSTPQIKPFMQSEQLPVEPIRYSDPDPLYPSTVITLETDKSQLEKPNEEEHLYQNEYSSHNIENADYEQLESGNKSDLVQISSQKYNKVSSSTSPPTTTTITATTLPTTLATTTAYPTKYTTTTISTLHKPAVKTTRSPSFVSTSTSENGLRALSRYRNGNSRYRSTSTTERPVMKWAPKRKTNNNSTTTKNDTIENNHVDDNSNRFKKMLLPTLLPTIQSSTTTTTVSNPSLTTTEATTTTTTTTTRPTTHSSKNNEVYEVLTQKSVSKSVSIKVGKNGEELPVIIDEQENEVQKY